MKKIVCETPEELGRQAACRAASILSATILTQGYARLVLSTGMSQFETLEALVKEDVNWTLVEMFHLDEYLGLPITHPASFRKYLQERFVDRVSLQAAHLINTDGEIPEILKELSRAILERPVDLALIGIGENAHIAFNDPPADFAVKQPYIVVDLDENCKRQQVREGWFASLDEVPSQALSMSVHQILQSRHILSVVPHQVKAQAIYKTLRHEISPAVPSTALRDHPRWELYLDKESASLL